MILLHYRKTQFSIDGSDALFVGWTAGERWNGWACPRFTKEEADKVMEDFNLSLHGPYIRYDEGTDTYHVPFNDGEEWDEHKGEIINTFEGPVKVYTIGAGYWVWDDLSNHNGRVNSGVLLKEEEEEE